MPEVDQSEDYDRIRRKVGGKTTKQTLDLLQNQDHIGSMKDELDVAHQTVLYHVEKLQAEGLVENTGEEEGRTYYKITEKGRVVLDGMNVPAY
ncbi:winged helix-turn-helix domain-containing protein [Candidatus Nanohalovita haloferacivicina]|uniref:winged helix-turn-helix domain-containing protein n=1 Tax=Candidatus Nanohalovita haloferacivicina TaxID=2978046 RepID=UPI00325FD97C|nr:hypothetical protein HBNXNv_0354 [Candidatus Nanohalobia archaeon BNXNv]